MRFERQLVGGITAGAGPIRGNIPGWTGEGSQEPVVTRTWVALLYSIVLGPGRRVVMAD